MSVLLCLCTVPNTGVARRLATLWVRRGHAACVTMLPPALSTYRWKGKVENSKELLLLVKTTPVGAKKIRAALKKDHPYECPEWLEFRAAGALAAYAKWIGDSVKI